MGNRPYCLSSAIVFCVVGVAHAWRAATAAALQLGTYSVPVWASWAIAAGALLLAAWGLRSAAR